MSNYIVTQHGVKANIGALQTNEVQHVFDLCKNGGTVVFPAGQYRVSSLRLWSNTTVVLQTGATIVGSTDCRDYQVFDPPAGMQFYHDGEMVSFDLDRCRRPIYRRAIFTAYQADNLAIVGEQGAVIDGADCYDPEGSEGFRGPHGFFFSSCRNVVFTGYTIRNTGNFAHQLDGCQNVCMQNLTVEAGHDGVHLNACKNISIENCTFETGDDCIAGINVYNLFVSHCRLNTACDSFRIGGVHIHIEHCTAEGGGKYPHRLSMYRDGKLVLPPEKGRYNTLYFMEFFGSESMPLAAPCDVTLTDCVIDNVDSFLHYEAENGMALHTGARLCKFTMRNVTVTRLGKPSVVQAVSEAPLQVEMQNVTVVDRAGNAATLFDGKDTNTIVRNC